MHLKNVEINKSSTNYRT